MDALQWAILIVCLSSSTSAQCPSGKWRCTTGECLDLAQVCDGLRDCVDGSDEAFQRCGVAEITCTESSFRCSNGACVDSDVVCNGHDDCIDGSDELQPNCLDVKLKLDNHNCGAAEFACSTGNRCIEKEKVCDGVADCDDASDETTLQCSSNPCADVEFRCAYGACVDGDAPCNGTAECADGSDEAAPQCNLKETGILRPARISKRAALADYKVLRGCGEVEGYRPLSAYGIRPKSPETFPWHAVIYELSYKKWERICAGSLITHKVIISAAHCFAVDVDGEEISKKDKSTLIVSFGTKYINLQKGQGEFSQIIQFKEILLHPGFKGRRGHFANNIALGVLTSNIVYNADVKPVCLLLEDPDDKSEPDGQVTGWGDTNKYGEGSADLRLTEVTPLSKEECMEKIEPLVVDFLTEDKTCGIDRKKNKTVCDKDSGGGYVSYNKKKGKFNLLGIVSTNVDERFCLKHILITRISYHVDFITDNLIKLGKDNLDNDWLNTTLLPFVNKNNSDKDSTSCPYPPQPQNGKYVCNPHCIRRPGNLIGNGSSLQYRCIVGYHLVGKEADAGTVYCLNGVWSPLPPTCQIDECEPLVSQKLDIKCQDAHQNSIPCNQTMPADSSATFDCKPYIYKKKTSLSYNTTNCNNGIWDPPLRDSFCVRVCRLPEFPQNGFYDFVSCSGDKECSLGPGDRVRNRSVLIYSCNDGYRLVEEKPRNGVVRCLNGVWSPNPPICSNECESLVSEKLEILCEDEDKKSISCNQKMHANSSATFDCKPVMYKKESILPYDTIYCKNGFWDPPLRDSFCVIACGRTEGGAAPFIGNGRPADPLKFPWHAAIYELILGNWTQNCAGSLINHKVLISAAHCFAVETELRDINRKNVSTIKVALGKYHRELSAKEDADFAKFFDVKEILLHPDFKGNWRKYADDIALVVLDGYVKYTIEVRPVCLLLDEPNEEWKLLQGPPGQVVGWGRTSEFNEGSAELRFAEIPIIRREECTRKINHRLFDFVTKDKMCGIDSAKKQTVCEGDSGGGYVFYNEETGQFTLRGVVSTGDAACTGLEHVLFTRISYHAGFIRDLLKRLGLSRH